MVGSGTTPNTCQPSHNVTESTSPSVSRTSSGQSTVRILEINQYDGLMSVTHSLEWIRGGKRVGTVERDWVIYRYGGVVSTTHLKWIGRVTGRSIKH